MFLTLAPSILMRKFTCIFTVFLGQSTCIACAGLCYNALWFFLVSMLIGGFASVILGGMTG